MTNIIKHLFLSTLACPTYGWQQQSRPSHLQIPPSEQLLIDQGIEIQDRARLLYPDGVLIDGENITAYEQGQLVRAMTEAQIPIHSKIELQRTMHLRHSALQAEIIFAALLFIRQISRPIVH